MSKVLVVDDKEMMRDSVATTLTRRGHSVVSVGGGDAALERLTRHTFDAVITDLQMPGMDGLELLAAIREVDDQLPVIFMTAYGTVETAVAALKRGAYDYITKPFSGDELIVAVDRAIEHRKLVHENQVLKVASSASSSSTSGRHHDLIGQGEAMNDLRERLARLADSHGTVLITGESGSGKEVAARWIHEHSPRAGAPFLAINCAALSTSLLESELFGHEKGAFTGADRLRKGRFELADGGTLLLDEISEIDPGIQAKLLRVLQEQTFERVGSSSSRAVDVRVIATSNRDLPAEVGSGAFREDLYFRLNVLPVQMPALRQHPEDIELLAEHFLKTVAGREGKTIKRFDSGAVEALRRYSWPGNVRELQNICERAAVLTNEETISAALIEPWLFMTHAPQSLNGQVTAKPASMIEVTENPSLIQGIICNGAITLEEIERESIVATLKHHNGHRQKSAAALGIGVRTLGLKLRKWKDQQLVSDSL